MSLLSQKMADFGNCYPFFIQNSILNPQSTVFTPEQINAIKAASASCSLFASLISHSGKKQPTSIPLPLPNPYHSSGLSRSGKSTNQPKRSSSSLFKRGARVRLVDGSIQKVEGLRTVDFIRAAKSTDFPLNTPRVLIITLFQPPITLNYQCSKEQPFFVQSHGWSSCDPQSTLSRFGLPCRPLSVGDHCLVVVPSEIAKLISSSAQRSLADFMTSPNPFLFNAKLKDMFPNFPNCVNIK
ncbi:unnamed protein product [Rodentolepis nana]|uniref:AXH domain-containing protein n=1 Tax=Rodentolepis nana TaxID=102285 RepID=A0A0R3TFI5_RODNA|nr:unnamed protein product [Rodentolepis nana]